jgi:hypothetical protein
MHKIICKVLKGRPILGIKNFIPYTGYIDVYNQNGKFLFSDFGNNITRLNCTKALNDALDIELNYHYKEG